jgi:hypothetical protein
MKRIDKKEQDSDSDYQVDPTGFDEMIRKAIAEVIAEKFLNGEIFVNVTDDNDNTQVKTTNNKD